MRIDPADRHRHIRKKDSPGEKDSGKLQDRSTLPAKDACSYRFDPRLGQSTLVEERFHPPPPEKKRASAPTPEYFNTFIGFGDSITWGQIEGVQRLDLCFLTQMRDVYLPVNYGPAEFINLGNPGERPSKVPSASTATWTGIPPFIFS